MANRCAQVAGLALVLVSACGGVSDPSNGVRTYENPDRHESENAPPQSAPERKVVLAPRWALDDGRRVMRAYKVTSLDATVLLGASGEVLFRSEAYPDFAALRVSVKQAVGQ